MNRVVREQVAGSLYQALCGLIGDNETANNVYKKYPTVKLLEQTNIPELCGVKGIGPIYAKRIKSAISIAKHYQIGQKDSKPIHSPEDSYDSFMPLLEHKQKECIMVMSLNTRNHVISIDQIYEGSLNATSIRIGELFIPAIKCGAAAVIMAHNHPSGDPAPSPDDITITKAVIKAGKLLDIQVLDHLVLGANRFISLNRKGLGFNHGEMKREGWE